jgi:hypothetical protein
MKQRFVPGADTWIASDSATSSFGGVFEDDGETAYFYAVDRAKAEGSILDAVHIYDVASLSDRGRESEAEIFWSSDGLKAGLLINERLLAIIDFERRKAYCRGNFPPPGGEWHAEHRDPWRDDLAALLD